MNECVKKLDRQKINEFWQRRTKLTDPRVATHFKSDNTLDYDVAFIKAYLPPQAHVLDLGCGTGAIALRLAPECAYICAVDQIASFLTHCADIPNISTCQADVVGYRDQHQYDLILLFGVLNYLDQSDAIAIFENCFPMLKPGGRLIVKHACGVHEDVVVDKFSEEMNDWYHAVYRFRGKESNLIANQFGNVEIFDIYPPELNRWGNTHYYAFVASKNSG